MSGTEYVSTATAARLLGLHGENGRRQVRRLVERGVLRSQRIGRLYDHRIPVEDVERLRASMFHAEQSDKSDKSDEPDREALQL